MKERRPLLLFPLITFCFWAPSYFYLQVLPDYARQLGGSLGVVGWIGGAYGLSQLILRLPVGMWSDALGYRKPFITAGMLAALVSALLFLLAGSASALFWARAIAGVSATIWVILTVYVAGIFPAGEGPRAMGLLNAFSSLGQLVSSASGGKMAEIWGPKAPFLASLATSALGLGLLAFLGKEKPRAREGASAGELLAVGWRHPVLLASILGIIYQYGYWAMLSFNTIVALDLGFRMGALGWLSLWNMAPTIAVSLCLGQIQGKWGQRVPLAAAFLLFALVTALMPFCRNPFELCLIIGLAGLARGVIYPMLMNLAISEAAPTQKGTAMGFFQAAYALGMFAGPAVSGFVAGRAGLRAAFLLAGLIMAAGGIGSWRATRSSGDL